MSSASKRPVTYRLRRSAATGPFWFTDLYLDVAWTPIVGPTVVQLLRSLNLSLLRPDGQASVDVVDLAASIGVAPSRLISAVGRAERFGLLGVSNVDTLLIADRFDAPPQHCLERLSTRDQLAIQWLFAESDTLSLSGATVR